MKHVIFQHGNLFFSEPVAERPILHELPPGTYNVLPHPKEERKYCLEKTENLQPIKRIYGSAHRHVDRWITSFEKREQNLGVLLVGVKGSGKTLNVKLLSSKMLAMSYPTLIVRGTLSGEAFNDFIASFTQPILLVYDEFDKTHGKTVSEDGHSNKARSQESVLGLLQGMVPGKRLVVFTANHLSQISEFLLNRPGRIRYVVHYEGIEAEAIREYVRENLRECTEDKIGEILQVARIAADFGYDMLEALVQEMNDYGEDAFTAGRYMVTLQSTRAVPHIAEVYQSGALITKRAFRSTGVTSASFTLTLQLAEGQDEKSALRISQADLVNATKAERRYVFIKGDYTVVVRELDFVSDHPILRRYDDFSQEHQDLQTIKKNSFGLVTRTNDSSRGWISIEDPSRLPNLPAAGGDAPSDEPIDGKND